MNFLRLFLLPLLVVVNWTEIPGSKLDVISATISMARDLVAIRLCYVLQLWVVTVETASGNRAADAVMRGNKRR